MSNVAQTIFQQVKAGHTGDVSGIHAMMCWGASKFVTVLVDNMHGLQFSVNGRKHRGRVQVLLNEGADMYEIRLTTIRGRVLLQREDVFCDELTALIDHMVESD